MTPGTLFSAKERFQAFLTSTNQKENVRLHLERLLSGLLTGEQAISIPKNPVIFDIGCGEGKMTAFLVSELVTRIHDMQLIAVDPSKAMTDLCRQHLADSNLLPESQTHFVTEEWWDNPNGIPQAALEQGAGFLAFAIHAHYYAKDIPAAVKAVEDNLMDPEGCAFFISQAPHSQMDGLRHRYSFSAETFRDGAGKTITTAQVGKARRHRTDEFFYKSSLWFPHDIDKKIQTIDTLLANNTPKAEWGSEDESFVRTVNVLEFILRDGLEIIDRDRARAFLAEFIATVRDNPLDPNDNRPRLIISEGIIPVPSSADIVPKINHALYQIRREEDSFSFRYTPHPAAQHATLS